MHPNSCWHFASKKKTSVFRAYHWILEIPIYNPPAMRLCIIDKHIPWGLCRWRRAVFVITERYAYREYRPHKPPCWTSDVIGSVQLLNKSWVIDSSFPRFVVTLREKMASAGQKVGSFFFAAFLVGAIVADWLCCIILEGLKTVGLLSNPTKVSGIRTDPRNHTCYFSYLFKSSQLGWKTTWILHFSAIELLSKHLMGSSRGSWGWEVGIRSCAVSCLKGATSAFCCSIAAKRILGS